MPSRAAAQKVALKPNQIRYWLTLPKHEQFEIKVGDKYGAIARFQGWRSKAIDEMTGIQAPERTHPGLPMLRARANGASLSTSSMASVWASFVEMVSQGIILPLA